MLYIGLGKHRRLVVGGIALVLKENGTVNATSYAKTKIRKWTMDVVG